LRQSRSGEAEKKLPTNFGTPKFITVVTTACHMPTSCASSVSSTQPVHFLLLHFIIPLRSPVYETFLQQTPRMSDDGQSLQIKCR